MDRCLRLKEYPDGVWAILFDADSDEDLACGHGETLKDALLDLANKVD